MTKTIEEAAKEYSADANVTSENFCAEDITDAFENGANYIMSLPLASRLTAEEKEQIMFAYKTAKTFAEHTNPMSAEVFKGQYLLLESIFGADLFKEEME